jgi:hypothetical protein
MSGLGYRLVTTRREQKMPVSESYIADLVARLNADAEAREVERKALIEDETPCDDEGCFWCN